MKIVRADFYVGDIERSDAPGFDMNYAILMLQLTFHLHEAAARDHSTIFFKRVRREDDIGNPRFIFEREKDETLCSSGALASNNATGNPNVMMIR